MIKSISIAALLLAFGHPALAQPVMPTVVLVHGAFEDGSSWTNVAAILRADHYPVLIAANPLRSVSADSASLAGLLKRLAGPVVLVGHSYGGVLISNVGMAGGNVKALVFVAAMAPDAGESIGALAGKFPGGALTGAISPTPLSDGSVDLYIRSDWYQSVLAGDLTRETTDLMAQGQRPGTLAMLQGLSGAPAWKTLPSWFVYGDADQSMPPALHAFLAKRAGARGKIVIVGGSHDVMISQPRRVADVIEQAADNRPKP